MINHDEMIQRYGALTTDLLEGIDNMITVLNDRNLANSLFGIQQQLTSFNTYRITEKPPKYDPKQILWGQFRLPPSCPPNILISLHDILNLYLS